MGHRAPPSSGARGGGGGWGGGGVGGEGRGRGGTADPDKLRVALGSLVTATVLGEYKVDPATGEQTATRPVLVQVLKGRAEVVWPRSLETAKQVLPYPQWSERQLLE